MGIPAKQIGQASSTTDALLWQISKQLERLTQVVANTTGTTTTAH